METKRTPLTPILGAGGTVVLVVVHYCLDAAQPIGKREPRKEDNANDTQLDAHQHPLDW